MKIRKELWFGFALMAMIVAAALFMLISVDRIERGHIGLLMLSLVVCSAVFGLAGLLVAVPLSAAGGVLARYALRRYLGSPLYTGATEPAPERPPVAFGPRIVEAGRD